MLKIYYKTASSESVFCQGSHGPAHQNRNSPSMLRHKQYKTRGALNNVSTRRVRDVLVPGFIHSEYNRYQYTARAASVNIAERALAASVKGPYFVAVC